MLRLLNSALLLCLLSAALQAQTGKPDDLPGFGTKKPPPPAAQPAPTAPTAPPTTSGSTALPAKTTSPKEAQTFKPKNPPFVFPVYEVQGRWMAVDRSPSGRKQLKKGDRLVVIGTGGADWFYAGSSTRSYAVRCRNRRQVPTYAFLLRADETASFEKVDTPLIALKLGPRSRVDPAQVRVQRLQDAHDEALYQRYEKTLKQAIVEDMLAGAFEVGSELGEPQVRIDFAADFGHAVFPQAKVLIDGVQIGASFRRCLRLFSRDAPVGRCALLPHGLMAETRQLEFYTYDPSGRGRPYILGHTPQAPMWGDERWGFQFTKKGPKTFFQDALDPQCRSSL